MRPEQRKTPAGHPIKQAPGAASLAEPATPALLPTAASDGSPNVSDEPTTNQRVRRRDEDQLAQAGLTAGDAASEQPDSQQELDKQAPAKRHKVTPASPDTDATQCSPGNWRPGWVAQRRERAAAAAAADKEQSYKTAFEEHQRVGRWLRDLEDARVTRASAAELAAQERDKQLVAEFMARHTRRGRCPKLLAAIASHPTRRQELLKVLRKEPPSAHEFLELTTVWRLYQEAKEEADAGAPDMAGSERPSE